MLLLSNPFLNNYQTNSISAVKKLYRRWTLFSSILFSVVSIQSRDAKVHHCLPYILHHPVLVQVKVWEVFANLTSVGHYFVCKGWYLGLKVMNAWNALPDVVSVFLLQFALIGQWVARMLNPTTSMNVYRSRNNEESAGLFARRECWHV